MSLISELLNVAYIPKTSPHNQTLRVGQWFDAGDVRHHAFLLVEVLNNVASGEIVYLYFAITCENEQLMSADIDLDLFDFQATATVVPLIVVVTFTCQVSLEYHTSIFLEGKYTDESVIGKHTIAVASIIISTTGILHVKIQLFLLVGEILPTSGVVTKIW